MELIPKYLDTSCIEAVCGGVETSTKLLGELPLEATIIIYTYKHITCNMHLRIHI